MTDSHAAPRDIARCRGVGSDADGWRIGCADCLRRTSGPGPVNMEPPACIVFECHDRLTTTQGANDDITEEADRKG